VDAVVYSTVFPSSLARMDHPLHARPTVAEIDGRALADNYAALARVVGPQVGVLPVVKSNAYGHGLIGVARILRDAGAERLAVATAEEGEALRAAGVHAAAIVLGGVYPADHARVVEARLTPVVWDYGTAQALAASARAVGRVVPLHVKVDTGMTRLGVAPPAAADLLVALGGLDGVTVDGIFTHFCNAESVAGPETTRQLASFRALVQALGERKLLPPTVHAANSAATLSTPEAHFDCVRPGLALYGIAPGGVDANAVGLRPVMRFVTRIVALRAVPAGTTVGYGGAFITTRSSRIATLPAGYADGYPRALSNRGRVVVRGVRTPIAGRVCMDHVMIDVTAVPDAAVGDEVVLWGGPLPVTEVAETAGTIPYELVTRVATRVPRVLL
jgi:alanine racemase